MNHTVAGSGDVPMDQVGEVVMAAIINARDLLTDAEHQVLHHLAEAFTACLDAGFAGADLREFSQTIHHAQAQVMAQAAARAYPDRYRLAQGTKP